MVLQAFREEEVHLIISGLTLGYGILLHINPQYLYNLNQVNLIIQSTAIGLFITSIFLIALLIYLKDNPYLREEKKSEIWDIWFNRITLLEILFGLFLITSGIFL